jgi:ligand-binding sensor domain-containing protein
VTYGVAEGLPHRFINALIETRSGDHWIGTPLGLSRIANPGGGARFTNYRLSPDPAANHILSLLETRSGGILAATEAGLFQWTDPSKFRRTPVQRIEGSAINDMVEDVSGNLWTATTTGIYVYGPGGIVQSLNARNGLPGNWVEMLLFDSKGRLWAAVRGGLAMISQRTTGIWSVEKVYSYNSGLGGSDVKALHEASDGSLWVGTQFGISRLSWGNG